VRAPPFPVTVRRRGHLCFRGTLRQRGKSARMSDSSSSAQSCKGETEGRGDASPNLASGGKEPGLHDSTQAKEPEQRSRLPIWSDHHHFTFAGPDFPRSASQSAAASTATARATGTAATGATGTAARATGTATARTTGTAATGATGTAAKQSFRKCCARRTSPGPATEPAGAGAPAV
jgi:hypothetical protein